MFFKKPPRSVRALIGQPFDKKTLVKAFEEAGVRQWFLDCETRSPIHNGVSVQIEQTHFYTTEKDNISVRLRPWFANRIAQRVADEFKETFSKAAIPENQTLEDIAKALQQQFGQMPEILDCMMAKLEESQVSQEQEMERICNKGFYPWDRIKYEITQVRLPYLDKSRAPLRMFHAFVRNDVLESVTYQRKPERAYF